ncbi:hypothetical protein [Streptacidiphilus anmyonensis]|uniref:hypothetical protein n=1 Tax=Streptacidiphilus anmyonensis TaxID=405782 RepID=UPI0005A93528|nr:hypothetical protein [Streptacidiphilus anmyonensis]
MNPALLGLAANPSLPADLLDRLVPMADEELASQLARRPDLTTGQVRALAARFESVAVQLVHDAALRAEDVDPDVQPLAALALLEEGVGLQRWVRRFADDPAAEYREKLAGCPGLPPEVLRRLADDPDVRVVSTLARHAPGLLAAELARHPHAEVRSWVAANEQTPPRSLRALLAGEGSEGTVGGLPPARACLVCDQEPVPPGRAPERPRGERRLLPGEACDGAHESTVHAMRCRALGNPATPVDAVAALAVHPSAKLRELVAAREGLPADVYARLAEDPVRRVRAVLAGNPSIDAAAIERLAEDEGPDVQRSLAHRPGLSLDVLTRIARSMRLGFVPLPCVVTATATEVAELATATHPALRRLVAVRHDLPEPIRDALAADPDAGVLAAIAPHPGLSEARLRAMVDRHGPRVADRVAANPNATPALLEQLVLRHAAAYSVLRTVAEHPNATVPVLLACLSQRRAGRHADPSAAAGRPELPPGVIAGLVDDDRWGVACAAGANPSLPVEVMRSLLTRHA